MSMARPFVVLALFAVSACDPSPVDTEIVPREFASVSVAQEGGAVCALSTEGAAYCWGGSNYRGNLGTGSVGPSESYVATPVRVAGGLRFKEVSPGVSYTCGTTQADELYCWGGKGIDGEPDATVVPAPKRLSGVRIAGIEALGWGFGVCGIVPSEEARCDTRQGTGSFLDLAPGHRFTALSRTHGYIGIGSPSRGGYSYLYGHQCGISAGRVLCWGDNWYGELGNGTRSPEGTAYPPPTNLTPRTATPTPVSSSLQFRVVGTGARFSCAVAADDSVWCWGWGTDGQTGNGSAGVTTVPTRVAGDLRLRTLSVGFQHSCGVDPDGVGWCWGKRGPAIGSEGVHGPARVAGDLRWKTISAGFSATCGVTVEGEVYCWGGGETGTLGNGALASSAVPVKVAFPS